MSPRLETEQLAAIVAAVPDVWLTGESFFSDVAAQRAAYVDYLVSRRDAADRFVEEAIDARSPLLATIYVGFIDPASGAARRDAVKQRISGLVRRGAPGENVPGE